MFSNILQALHTINSSVEEASIDFPSIIVIGEESSGKSSTLESIIRRKIFVKNRQICTKCPTKIYINSPNEHKIYSDEEIYTNLQKHMNSIKDIDDQIYEIYIDDKTLPNIVLLDLPGIVSFPEEHTLKTISVVEKMLDQHSIILLTVPATDTRLTNNRAIAMLNKRGLIEQTILVFTMCDKLDSEDIPYLFKRLNKDKEELAGLNFLDCYGIINRNTNTTDFLEMFKKENNFLTNYFEEWSALNIDFDNIKKHFGVQDLVKYLGVTYIKYIKNTYIPDYINHLTSERNQFKEMRDDHDKILLLDQFFDICAKWSDSCLEMSNIQPIIVLRSIYTPEWEKTLSRYWDDYFDGCTINSLDNYNNYYDEYLNYHKYNEVCHIIDNLYHQTLKDFFQKNRKEIINDSRMVIKMQLFGYDNEYAYDQQRHKDIIVLNIKRTLRKEITNYFSINGKNIKKLLDNSHNTYVNDLYTTYQPLINDLDNKILALQNIK